jgi:protein tyrosine/serine phosphatase
MKPFILALLLFGGISSPGQVLRAIDTSGLPRELTAAGSKLKHFDVVDEGVYKGSAPRSDADYRFLQSIHVKYIVDLQVSPLMTIFERRKAKRYGIKVIPGIMNASPISPSEKHIAKILATLRDERFHPIYFHCKFGRDRTNVIAALYKMYFQGMPPEEAPKYLRDSGYGYTFGWLRSGLTRYVKRHPTPPAGLLSTAEKQ